MIVENIDRKFKEPRQFLDKWFLELYRLLFGFSLSGFGYFFE